ncbi:PRC-barrel domain-containing protein [Sphingomonas sp.]|uniref:PRC-barrel domain-containing protein n=1 Tax=Sphingomonas sp. TaxID=28214 RepID=UPI00286D7234|nr:PRC-barrel domain-containing protein [Sphingomonas sp.]
METIVSWVATAATIAAACMTASNLGARITGYGFIVFTIGSIAWLTLGILTGQPALMWTNIALTGLNLFGVWRWLGRQAQVEDGAQRAAAKSAGLASETLFPATLLSRAALVGRDGRELGTLVDAMIGNASGRLSYLVVAEGGVAGVGETLRRVEWDGAAIDSEQVRAPLDGAGFAQLPTLARDNWPGR